MLHIMNAENWIDPRSEMRYQFHQTIVTGDKGQTEYDG